MGLLDKVKDKIQHHSSSSTSTSASAQTAVSFPPAPPRQPLEQSLYRYRKQYGINLGSWFALERWISPGVFSNAQQPAQSDLDVAKSGPDARTALERHWDTWIQEEDWVWIKDRGFNSVRIPIGYYHLSGVCPEALVGTDFESVSEVYQGAWERIVKAIKDAERHGLGVLIDLHGAAGAQNTDAHSGISTGKVNLWSSSTNLRSTSIALQFLASTLCKYPNIIGLELLNEPQNNNGLQGWYESTINSLRTVCDPDFPLYISDAWDTAWYSGFVGQRIESNGEFIVLDHHLYRCFTDDDKSLNGDQHASKLKGSFGDEFSGFSDKAKGSIVVGEWSGSLDPQSFPNGVSDQEKDRHRRVFVSAQMELFERSTAGWWFWTYKKEEGWDAGWSAKNAAQAEILPNWVGGKKFKGSPPAQMRNEAMQRDHDSHVNYWKSHGGSPDPSVFPSAFQRGWDDTLLFLNMNPTSSNQLGFTAQWIRRRREAFESSSGKQLGKGAWEWDHGFEQGCKACLEISLDD